jgi:hypothetical protein
VTTATPEPIYAWQVLDDDGRWGTIATQIPDVGYGVLETRDEALARGPLSGIAALHAGRTGKPVRLHRFLYDPAFDGGGHDG